MFVPLQQSNVGCYLMWGCFSGHCSRLFLKGSPENQKVVCLGQFHNKSAVFEEDGLSTFEADYNKIQPTMKEK